MKTADRAVYLCIYTELYSNSVSEQCPLLQVRMQMKRTHFTAGYTLYNCACDKKNIIFIFYKTDIRLWSNAQISVNRYIGRSLPLTQTCQGIWLQLLSEASYLGWEEEELDCCPVVPPNLATVVVSIPLSFTKVDLEKCSTVSLAHQRILCMSPNSW